MEGRRGERLQAASAPPQVAAMTSRSYWTAVWCGFLVLTIGLGVRQSFGIFLKPVSAELHVGRELFSFGTAAVDAADGRRRAASPAGCATASARPSTIAGGGVLYVLGMVVTATMHDGSMLILGNILVGVGLSAASFGPVLGVILRVAPPAKAALAVGICSAGGSFGQFFIVPLASVLQNYFGDWRPTMWALTALAVLIMLLPIGLNDSKRDRRRQEGQAGGKQTSRRGAVARRSASAATCCWWSATSSAASMSPSWAAICRPTSPTRASACRCSASPLAGRAGRLEHRHGRPVQHRGLDPVERDGQPVPAQEPAVAALPAALAGLPGLRPGAAVGRLGADLRRARWASCGSAPCRSPRRWSATSSGRSISPC